MQRRTFLTGSAALLASFTVAGCNHYYQGPPPHAPAYGRRYGGPPPHAPAHGYRHHHRSGVDLVYDSGLGVYVVVGLGGYYYHDHFYRYHDGYWQWGPGPRGPWRRARERDVPHRLYQSRARKRRKGRDDDNDQGRGRGRGNR